MTEMEEELRPCTVCGKPVLWGTRHPVCGQRVMAPGAGVARHCGNCADGWRKFPEVPAPVGPVLVTSASKVVWMADFYQSENVWRVGSGRDMVKLPPDAVTHWMPLPLAAGLDGVLGLDETKGENRG